MIRLHIRNIFVQKVKYSKPSQNYTADTLQTKSHGKKNNQVSIDFTYSNGPSTSAAQSGYRGGRG